MLWGRGPSSFFDMWMSSCPRTICQKDCSFVFERSWHPVEKQSSIDTWDYFRTLSSTLLVYMSILLPVPHCLNCKKGWTNQPPAFDGKVPECRDPTSVSPVAPRSSQRGPLPWMGCGPDPDLSTEDWVRQIWVRDLPELDDRWLEGFKPRDKVKDDFIAFSLSAWHDYHSHVRTVEGKWET